MCPVRELNTECEPAMGGHRRLYHSNNLVSPSLIVCSGKTIALIKTLKYGTDFLCTHKHNFNLKTVRTSLVKSTIKFAAECKYEVIGRDQSAGAGLTTSVGSYATRPHLHSNYSSRCCCCSLLECLIAGANGGALLQSELHRPPC